MIPFSIYHFSSAKNLPQYATELQKRMGKSLKMEKLDAKKIKWDVFLQKLPQNTYLLVLDETGADMKSLPFAKTLEKLTTQGRKLVFLLGPAEGLPENVKEKADFLLCFSRFTWTYDLCLTMLIEQLYRVQQILKGTGFHKE